jgi:hypothetical protein
MLTFTMASRGAEITGSFFCPQSTRPTDSKQAAFIFPSQTIERVNKKEPIAKAIYKKIPRATTRGIQFSFSISS